MTSPFVDLSADAARRRPNSAGLNIIDDER
jgi:hypothetical protein